MTATKDVLISKDRFKFYSTLSNSYVYFTFLSLSFQTMKIIFSAWCAEFLN